MSEISVAKPVVQTQMKKFTAENVAEEFRKIRTQYGAESGNETFNCLIMGNWKSGKTTFASTGRQPVVIHSFDPGGMTSIRQKLDDENQQVYAINFAEGVKDAAQIYEDWVKEFFRLKDSGFFNNVGTFVIDSLTTFSEALMAYIMKKDSRPTSNGQGITLNVPQIQDYQKQTLSIKEIIKLCTALPCDFVITAHIETDKDEVTGKIITTPMVSGKFKQQLPLLFDEVYVALVKPGTDKESNYQILTQADGIYTAGSRLSNNKQLAKFEVPNIKEILKKAGKNYQDVTS